MGRPLIPWAGVVAAAAVVGTAMAAHAETFSLELKRLERAGDRMTKPPPDYMFRGLYPQHFFRQTGVGAAPRPRQDDEAEFDKVITKEPASYHSKFPFRGVAKLGSQQFGFVLDEPESPEKAELPKSERKKPVQPGRAAQRAPVPINYGRLLFDCNCNGDLTDDPVIEAPAARAGLLFPAGYSAFSFPRVDLTVNVDGAPIEYAFVLSGFSNSMYLNEKQAYQYIALSLNAAAYRDGEITLEGKKRRIVVTDFNSNGRFDDRSAMDDTAGAPGDELNPRQGDMIFIDPPLEGPPYAFGYNPTTSDAQHPLAKMICIEGCYYDIRITPAGDKLSLTRSSAAVGHVSNSNQGYRALVYHDQGILKIQGDETGRAPLPVGSWKLLNYTILRTEEKADEKRAGAEPSLLQALSDALLRRDRVSRPKFTMISARATGAYPAVEVRKGEITKLPFGGPYRPKVSGTVVRNGSLSLGMELIGSGGEVCDNLMVDGDRPGKPAFTITGPDGAVVASGNFEYG